MNKKNIVYWTLYDFANSLVVIVFAVYFPKWLVVDNGISDLWYNLIFVGASLIFILSAPMFASRADKLGQNIPYLRTLTLLFILAILGVSFIAVFAPASKAAAALAAFLFMLANYFYQFAIVLYNALLPQLAPTKQLQIVSGVGQAGNWAGQLVGLLITLPFATGALYVIGHPGSVQTFLPAILASILLALPLLLFFKEKKRPEQAVVSLAEEYHNAYRSFVSLVRIPAVGKFLLGYFLFNDAMITVVNNFPIYVDQVFQVTEKMKSMLVVGLLIMAALGALAGAALAQRAGHKKALIIILTAWIVIFPMVALVRNLTLFSIVIIAVGLLYGATFAVTRVFMSLITPPERINQGFSYYTLVERFSTFIGPLTWGIIVSGLASIGEWRYRLAVLVMTGFVIAGTLIVRKVSLVSQNRPS